MKALLKVFLQMALRAKQSHLKLSEKYLTSFKMPPIESILGELDEKAISDMKKMMNSILEEISNIEPEDEVKMDDSGYLPNLTENGIVRNPPHLKVVFDQVECVILL